MDILEIIDDRGHYIDGRFAGELIKPFPCPDQRCSKSFNRKSDLQRHYRIHTNERPYGCNACGKRFIQRSALTVHFRTHTGEKPHKCEYIGCGKCFSDSSSLARHRRIHTGKRPYGCHIGNCEKRFVRKTSLTKHQQKTHNMKKPESNNSYHDHDGSETEVDTPRHHSECSTPAPPLPQKPSNDPSFSVQYTPNTTSSLSRAHTPSSLHPTAEYYTHPHGGPLTPHTPSFCESDASSYAATYYSHPPTPHSPHHPHIKQEPHSSCATPRPHDLHPHHPQQQQELRMSLSPPSPYHLLTQAATLQNSPGSLSSCSSVSTSAQSDYFCNAPGYEVPGQFQMNQIPLHIQQMAQMQLVGAQFQAPVEQQQLVGQAMGQQECWFEVQPYQAQLLQHQGMVAGQEVGQQQHQEQQRFYGDVGGMEMIVPVKQETGEVVMMMTGAGSFCA